MFNHHNNKSNKKKTIPKLVNLTKDAIHLSQFRIVELYNNMGGMIDLILTFSITFMNIILIDPTIDYTYLSC